MSDKYTLTKKPSSKRQQFIVTIKADSNDGDYVTERMTFSPTEFEEAIPHLKDLRDNYSGSHQLTDYPNGWELDIPYNGYDGYCHTLTELKIEYVDEDGVTWDVTLN